MATEEMEMEVFNNNADDVVGDVDSDVEPLVADRPGDVHTIKIERGRLNEADFEEGFHPVSSKMKKNWYKSFLPPEPIRSSLCPSASLQGLKTFVFTHLPILSWLWTYQFRQLIGDCIAGITVAVMQIPQGLAYGQLAGLPPVYGLYGSFIPVIVYTFFGTSRHISVGTFAVVSLMVSNGINRVFESDEEFFPCLNSSDTNVTWVNINGEDISCDDLKVDIAVTLAFMSGIIMLVLGLFKFGFITILLSESLVSGYTTGAAVHVFTSQLKHIFGLKLESIRTIPTVPRTWIEAFKLITKTNKATLIISVITIIVLIAFRIIDRKLLRKLKVPCWLYSLPTKSCVKQKIQWFIPLPSQLIVVIFAAALSYAAKFEEQFDVDIVREVPLGLPSFTPPHRSYMRILIQDAAVISIVTFSVAVSLAQVFAKQFQYTIYPDQEFIAYGCMNLVGSLFGSLNTAGSLSRSTVQAVSGGKTQLVGFISSGIILLVLVALGHLFEPLPNAVLASIIWVALYGMFSQTRDIWRYFKLSVPDMCIWIVVFLATVLLGVDLGLGVGVAFSIFVIIFKIILPKSAELGKAHGTEIYRDIDNFEMVKSIPGVVIYRFQAPLCFVNCKVFQARIDIVCGIDRSSMGNTDGEGCIQAMFSKVLNYGRSRYKGSRSRSWTLQHDLRGSSSANDVKTLILDCSPIGFMDAMGVKAIQQLVLDFDVYGIQVLFAALTKNNREMLERIGFFDKCGKEWLFPSVQDAVNHALQGTKLHPGDKEDNLVETTNIDIDNETSNGSKEV